MTKKNTEPLVVEIISDERGISLVFSFPIQRLGLTTQEAMTLAGRLAALAYEREAKERAVREKAKLHG
jgi:hypothetical protein